MFRQFYISSILCEFLKSTKQGDNVYGYLAKLSH